jgi:D-3-phosphoglycerate dehydrogenase
MKPTAYLINTARGPLIDDPALYTALSQGYIAGAGLDVMELEPPSLDNPLFKLDNVIITAHSAHYSEFSTLELRRRPIEEVVRVLKGELPRNLVNPKVKEKFLQRWGKR